MIVNVMTTAAYFFAGPDDMVFLYAMNIIGGFASGPVSPLIWALYADTADYSEWKTGRRATGLVFSAGTFAQKMGWTVGGSLAGLPARLLWLPGQRRADDGVAARASGCS